MSFVRCPISGDEEIEGAEGRLLRLAGGVQRLDHAALEIGETLCRLFARELIEFGVRERNDHFAMRGERPSQRPNRAADLDEPVQVFSSHLGGIGHDPRVEILQLPLDVIQGAEVAGDDPVENLGDERGSVKRAT